MIEEQAENEPKDDIEQAYGLIFSLAKRMGTSVDAQWHTADIKSLAFGIAHLCEVVESLYE